MVPAATGASGDAGGDANGDAAASAAAEPGPEPGLDRRDHAQRVGAIGELGVAGAPADRDRAAGRRGGPRGDRRGEDRGAGRGAQLAREPAVGHHAAGVAQDLERRRRRHRQHAVRAGQRAVAHRDAGAGHRGRAEPVERRGGADDVDHRVDRADLVKRDVVDRHAVHPGLGAGDPIEDVERAAPGARRELGGGDPGADRRVVDVRAVGGAVRVAVAGGAVAGGAVIGAVRMAVAGGAMIGAVRMAGAAGAVPMALIGAVPPSGAMIVPLAVIGAVIGAVPMLVPMAMLVRGLVVRAVARRVAVVMGGRRRGVAVRPDPGELAGGVDLDVDRRDAVRDHPGHLQPPAAGADRVERGADRVERHAEVDQRAEHHVARRAARPVDVEVQAAQLAAAGGHRAAARRAIRTAATAAPTPLSMLTTVIPGAHDASIAPSATSPSSDTP